MRGTLWKIFCPAVKHAKMHFCWHFLRPLVTSPCRRLWTTTTFGQRLLRAYYEHSAEVDDLISAHLRNWTMERLPRVSLTVLRLGLAEMLYGDEKKPGVVINEAVELTKKYGADEDYQFVNGLLGTVAREQGLDAESEQL